MNEEEQAKYLIAWQEMIEDTKARDITPMELDRPLPEKDFAIDRAERNYEHGQYLAQGGVDHPNMNTAQKQTRKKITPDEAEERGIVGQFVDVASDFSLGLATGVGYGADELAVSFSKVSNMLVPDFIDGGNEYEGRYISEYLDQLTKSSGLYGNGVVEAGQSISQFLMGWIPSVRAVKMISAAGKGVKALKGGAEYLGKTVPSNFVASALAGATAYSPTHKNIGNDLQGIDNYLAGAVSRALATDPNDPEWKNRLRNAMQEGGLAVVGDKLLFPLLKGAAGVAGKAGKAGLEGVSGAMKSEYIAPVHEKFIEMLGLVKQTRAKEIRQKFGINGQSKARLGIDADGKTTVTPDASILAREASALGEAVSVGIGKQSIKIAVPDGSTVESTVKAMESSGELADKFAGAANLDERWDLANDLAREMRQKGGKGSGEYWRKGGQAIFDEYGLDVDTVRAIQDNTAMNPEQIYAVAHVARSTADDLLTSIKEIKAIGDSAGLDMAEETMLEANNAFVRRLVDYIDVTNITKDIASTTGKALRAVRELKNNPLGDEVSREILSSPELSNMLKGTKFGGVETTRIAAMLNQAVLSKGMKGLTGTISKGIDDGFINGNINMFIEAWINQGLLSNPATHVMNMVIGTANIASHVGSQVVAASMSKIPFASKMLGTEDVTFREAWGSMYGIMAGLGKAFQLSWKASITGDSAFGAVSKLDNYGFQHIAAKTVGMEDTAMGLAIDYMGSLTRSSGRFLLMEDEFVKTVASEMKKHSLAWKYGFANGNRSKGAKELYRDIIDHPELFKERIGDTDFTIEQQMKELAELVTFQKKNGQLVEGLKKATHLLPVLKLGMPFIKVLANIPKFTVQHSPLGMAFKSEEFKRGGASKMLEYGRMGYGTMMMLYGAHMYGRGDMTGSGPREYWKARNIKESGVAPPKSIKIKSPYAKANESYWIDITRFSPYSNLLAMGADASAIMNAHEDMPISEIMEKGLVSVQQNLVDPTWAPSLHKLLGVAADSSSEPGNWKRAIKSIVGTLQPAFVRSNEKLKHPGKPELKTFHADAMSAGDYRPQDWSSLTAQLLATSSNHSDLVPTANNFLGDEVKHERGLDGGLPGFLTDPVWSFLNIRKADETPALKHVLADLEVDLKRPSDIVKVGGIPVRLTPFEYKEYTRRVGKQNNRNGDNLKEAFTRMYESPRYKKLMQAGETNPHRINDMKDIMLATYNASVRGARNSIIYDFRLRKRARGLIEEFGE